jgi:hypothetical protein
MRRAAASQKLMREAITGLPPFREELSLDPLKVKANRLGLGSGEGPRPSQRS